MNRPLVVVALGLAAGLLAAGEGWLSGPWAAAPFAAAAVLPFAARGRAGRDAAFVFLLLMGAGAVWWEARNAGRGIDALAAYSSAHPSARYVLDGVVREPDLFLPGDVYARFILDVDRVERRGEALDLRGRTVVRWSEPAFAVYPGERVRVRGELSVDLGPVNFDVRGPEQYFHARDVYTQLRAAGAEVEALSPPRWAFESWAARLRERQARVFQESAPPEVLPFLLTIWLGDRGAHGPAARAFYERHVASGTAHILSVSGLHVGIVFLTLDLILRVLVPSRRLRSILVLTGVFLFALTAGARVPTLRAALMVAVYVAADWFRREPDALNALAAASLLFLIPEPRLIYDLSFHLSFGSIASLLLFTSRIAEWIPRAPWWLKSNLGAVFAVQIVPLPLAIGAFHVFPVFAPAANLLVIPLVTALLWCCFLIQCVGVLFPPAAVLFGHAAAPVVLAIDGLAALVASLPGSHVTLPPPTRSGLLLYWTAAALLGWSLGAHRFRPRPGITLPAAPPRSWKMLALTSPALWPFRARLCVTASVLLLAGAAWLPWSAPPTIDFLDVGHGDSAFVRTPGGTTLLIDGGDRSEYGDLGEQVVVPFLRAQGIRRLDYAVMTHPDRDHAGGLITVLEKIGAGEVVLGPVSTGRELEKELLALCARRGIPVRRLHRGDRIPAHGAEIEVLHPPAEGFTGDGINDGSLVMRMTWPGVSALFTGDIEGPGERLLADGTCRAEILKAPHHGSHTSSTPMFLDAVRPVHAVISTQASRARSATGAGVIERYEARGVRIWRTDRDGGIRFRMGAGGIYTPAAAREEGVGRMGAIRP